MKKINVLVVDDSAMIRKLVTKILTSDPEINVIGTAADPFIARDKIKALNPDVLTLDIEMPKMDGISFLKNVMRLRPMPIVMLSTLTSKGAESTLEALRLGAVDFICKPQGGSANLEEAAAEIIAKVKIAAKVRIRDIGNRSTPKANADIDSEFVSSEQAKFKTGVLIAIGASTGGTEAIREVLERLPSFTPPIVIAQHIPKEFSKPFAKRMNAASKMTVVEAAHHQEILPGHVYIAPGSHHLRVEKFGSGKLRCCLDLEDPVNRHRPSVDVLFNSVADVMGKNCVGVILTGMGKDGAKGLKYLRDKGAHTIAQDEQSSVIWGMPGESVKLGGAAEVKPLDKISVRLLMACKDSRVIRKTSGLNKVK